MWLLEGWVRTLVPGRHSPMWMWDSLFMILSPLDKIEKSGSFSLKHEAPSLQSMVFLLEASRWLIERNCFVYILFAYIVYICIHCIYLYTLYIFVYIPRKGVMVRRLQYSQVCQENWDRVLNVKDLLVVPVWTPAFCWVLKSAGLQSETIVSTPQEGTLPTWKPHERLKVIQG